MSRYPEANTFTPLLSDTTTWQLNPEGEIMGAVKQAWAQEMEELLDVIDIDSGWDTYFQSKQHKMNVLTDTAFYSLLENDDRAECLKLLSQVLVLQEELFLSPVTERTSCR